MFSPMQFVERTAPEHPEASGGRGRYARGVANPRPEVLARIRAELAREPTISGVDLAQRVGVSRATARYYRRHLRAEGPRPNEGDSVVASAPVISHTELVARVTRAADEVWADLAKLRAEGVSPATASVIFRGFATLERHHRLLAELVGDVGPVEHNVLIGQLQVLLREPVDLGSLSPSARLALGRSGDRG